MRTFLFFDNSRVIEKEHENKATRARHFLRRGKFHPQRLDGARDAPTRPRMFSHSKDLACSRIEERSVTDYRKRNPRTRCRDDGTPIIKRAHARGTMRRGSIAVGPRSLLAFNPRNFLDHRYLADGGCVRAHSSELEYPSRLGAAHARARN